jgi:hypothetical protein
VVTWLQNEVKNGSNKLRFFQALLSYLYLLSFVLHEDFLWDRATIEPVRIFLQVIGIPAWSLPKMYASGQRAHRHRFQVAGRMRGRVTSGRGLERGAVAEPSVPRALFAADISFAWRCAAQSSSWSSPLVW